MDFLAQKLLSAPHLSWRKFVRSIANFNDLSVVVDESNRCRFVIVSVNTLATLLKEKEEAKKESTKERKEEEKETTTKTTTTCATDVALRPPRPAFVKPTLLEIRSFISSRNSAVDPEGFFFYYESNGWTVGRQKMRDWRAAVRTWERRPQNVSPGGYQNGITQAPRQPSILDKLFPAS